MWLYDDEKSYTNEGEDWLVHFSVLSNCHKHLYQWSCSRNKNTGVVWHAGPGGWNRHESQKAILSVI
jgi:hypothetical protein